jgi:hypothetical protein
LELEEMILATESETATAYKVMALRNYYGIRGTQ